MLTNNPFEDIVRRLELIQMAITRIEFHLNQKKETIAPDPERLIDLVEAASIIKRPIGTVRYYIHHRGLPATKVGKGFLVKHSQLLNWFEQFNLNDSNKDIDPVLNMKATRNRYSKG